MVQRAETDKTQLVENAAALCRDRADVGDQEALASFVRLFYAHVPPEDVLERAPEDLFGAAASLWRFAAVREPGKAKLRVINPDPARDGWSSSRTIVEIVNDDMPFLVDSVTAALNGYGATVKLVIHPVVRVRRDRSGRILELLSGPEPNGDDALRESMMHVEIGEERDPARLKAIAATLENVLLDVRHAVMDWQPMRSALARVLDELGANPPALPPKEVAEGIAFLRWLDEDNFTFLGYREYRFGGEDIVEGAAGLGILRDENYSVFDLRRHGELPPDMRDFLHQPRLLFIAKSNQRATVHRPAHMDAIGVKEFGADGRVVGMRLFLGLFTSLAYSRSPRAIPLLRQKVQKAMTRAGFAPQSHDGKALLHILDNFPRDELFQISDEDLFETAMGILHLQERQRIALFLRRDPFDRFVSALVYVPRDRYSTDLRLAFAKILEDACKGTVSAFYTQLDESVLARIHFIIRTERGRMPPIDPAAIERQLAEVGRSWADKLRDAAPELMPRWGGAFPTTYRERTDTQEAIEDIAIAEKVLAGAPIGLRLYERPEGLSFKLFHATASVALSDVLPMLENMGLRVLTEVEHALHPSGVPNPFWLHDYLLEPRAPVDVPTLRPRFEEAFAKVWSGEMESDGLNRLVLFAGLDWRQVVILRTYTKILRQSAATFSQSYMEDALAAHPEITAALVRLFERRFDPGREADRDRECDEIAREIGSALEGVTNLDQDRILRSFLLLVQKTLRTNYFLQKPYVSVKLFSREIDVFPAPRPLYEIYVYSPRVEGVHLRGGKVARGGIRWSDRKEDFRTEILGLLKAQMVKNAVIVPVGSKGGFVVKRPPAGREAQLAEGVECYKTYIRGLLDITDNIVGTRVVPPEKVVRHDDDDPYLVVAADKGTAAFSDIANGVAKEYGFWLGDAFASGGSAGYDHKGMGITARGAWEAVKRHFRELGTDIQTTPFTCVGVGDMSGDVFGNGMLLSPQTKLVAAFDHRHIFVDPDPDPATSLAERRRLFEKPRSSWADYDKSLLSKGGAVYERSAKSIELSPEARARLGLDSERMTPAELMRGILKAPVDLLWFGGIGTFVKGSTETNAEVGDRANDAVRIDGRDIRAKVVGEGANLGCTQRGRIEYALAGGRINTDAIDNSAGVDTSDHEVNIKILLDSQGLDEDSRRKLLAEMTDEVAALVLRDNYLQTLAISLAEARAFELLDAHQRLIRTLEKEGRLDRALEFLPDDEAIAERAAQRRGLTRPELAVLLAYAKNALYAELLPSDLPDDQQLVADLLRYFPRPLRRRFRAGIEQHRLRREIIATFVTNSIVNRAGISFVNELKLETGRPASDIARAYAVTRDAFRLRPLWTAIEELDNKVPAQIQYDMLLAAGRLVERSTLWFLRSGLPLGDVQALLDRFAPGIAALDRQLAEILPEPERAALRHRIEKLAETGVPEPLAAQVARLEFLLSAADIVRLQESAGLEVTEVGRVYFHAGARFGLDRLRGAARRLKAETAYQKMAVAALVDDFFQLQTELSARVIAEGGTVDAWAAGRGPAIAPVDAALNDMLGTAEPDLAMLTVAARQMRALLG
jgi:glutamate dehydrogenase